MWADNNCQLIYLYMVGSVSVGYILCVKVLTAERLGAIFSAVNAT